MRAAVLVAWGLLWSAGGCGTSTFEPPPQGPADWVLDPQKVHFGGSYSDWSVLWWQWAMEMPVAGHPLYDETGADAITRQVDPVWFIGGKFGSLFAPSTGAATRTITIPGDVALFFPIINAGWDNEICVPSDWVDRTVAELAQLAYEQVNLVSDVYCTVDGVPIIDSADLSGAVRYRAISATFSYSAPEQHVGTEACGDPPGAKLVTPAVSDGIWMMLRLPPGPHTVTFGGTLPTAGSGEFRIDITYHVTVTP
jgi:hypothetical protein